MARGLPLLSVVSVRGQVDEPSRGGAEAAGIEVEPGEMLFEVHVQPLAPGRPGVPGSMVDQRRGDPLSLVLCGDLGVEEEGVITPVPGHVDKADQGAVRLTGTDPAKAVRPDLIPPPGRSAAAVGCPEGHHLCVGDRPAPAILNRLGHTPDRAADRWRGQQISAAKSLSGHPRQR
jgi:hypothetical protein